MKKQAYIVLLLVSIVVLFNCVGQTSCEYPENVTYSILLGENFRGIVYQAAANGGQAGLVGSWISENAAEHSLSRIRFDERGYFQENIYSQPDRQLLASFSGQYRTEENALTIMLDSGNRYRFIYTLTEDRLRLTTYLAGTESMNPVD